MFRTCTIALAALLVGLCLTASRVTAEEGKKEVGGISGKVTDASGNAVAGAQVRVMRPADRKNKGETPAVAGEDKGATGDKAKGDKPKPVAETTTDSDGKYALSDIPVGSYMIGARVKGTGQAKQKVEVKAGEIVTVDLKLEAPKAK